VPDDGFIEAEKCKQNQQERNVSCMWRKV